MTSRQLKPFPICKTKAQTTFPLTPQNRVQSITSKSSLTFSSTQTLKLPEIKQAKSSRTLSSNPSYLFPGLKPKQTLATFLRIEEERIIENKNKRATNSEFIKQKQQNNEGKKKKKKANKSKNMKKVKSLPSIISPYQLIQSLK